jgi:hypothetical protein
MVLYLRASNEEIRDETNRVICVISVLMKLIVEEMAERIAI